MKFCCFLIFSLVLQTLSAEENPSPPLQAVIIQTENEKFVISKLEEEETLNFNGREFLLNLTELNQIVEKYLGKPITVGLIKKLRLEISKNLHEMGDHLAKVAIPDQDVSCGEVKLIVSHPCIQNIQICGNKWFSEREFLRPLEENEGERLDEDRLLNSLAWLNRNPFRRVEATLVPQGKDNVDIELKVQDRFPVRFFVGADNTGTQFINSVRLFGGFTWGDLFGLGDLLNYQFTSGPSTHDFYAHTVEFVFYTPAKREVSLYGGYSTAHPEITGMKSEAKDAQASFRYNIPFQPLYTATQQELILGFDYKYLNSNVFFISELAEIPIVTHSLNLSQFSIGYLLKKGPLLRIEAFVSPFRWLGNQTNALYNNLRPHAKVEYAYFKASCGYNYPIAKKITLAGLFRGQVATGPLLPSEQFGLGGYNTVRGYRERDFIADNAICLNFEARLWNFSIYKKGKDLVEPLVFTDFGWGSNYYPPDGDLRQKYLWSAGPGIRYNFGTNFQFRFDYGFRFHHIFSESGIGRGHASAIASY